ncbi:MAG: hypothetical protein ACRD0X_01620 [Thermoanaerobaculia bacterium]
MTPSKAALAFALVAAAVILAAQEPERAKEPLGPAGVGVTDEGVRFQLPATEPIEIRQPEPLRVERLEAHELAPGTHWGAPGDLLVTIHGRGFQETARSPRLELANGTVLVDETVVDAEGTQLFAVIPRQRVAELERLSFQEVVVANPGARQSSDYARATVKAGAAELLRPPPDAARALLVYRDGRFVRELVVR